jgi:Protein of unknown function (DUF4235)
VAKILYKPLGLGVSIVGGILASAVFKQVWRKAAGEDDAPDALQSEYGWREIMLASALQGAVFGLVKAVVDRGAAQGFRKLTGTWPGD